MSFASSRDRASPPFQATHSTRSSRHGIKSREEKTDTGKNQGNRAQIQMKSGEIQSGKTDVGENQGNCGEIRNWKLSGVAMMENWLGTAF